MVSLLLTSVLALYAWQQRNIFIAILLLPSLFFFALAYELKDSTLSADYFEFDSVHDYSMYVAFGVSQFIAVILALNRRICGRAPYLKPPGPLPSIPVSRTKALYYSLACVATIAFFVNLSHVNFSVSLMFVDPRGYEELFGQSTAINYLYFLNIPALCLSIYLRQQRRHPRFANVIDTMLVLMSLFHGIKFTVFDTLLLPALFYFHCSRKPRRAMWLLGQTLLLLMVFYIVFSLGVRGFAEDQGSMFAGVLNYILPNYYNFAYGLQLNPLQLEPIGFLLPDKMPNPFLPILAPGEYGFLLNDRYNMATAYTVIYASLPPFSWLLFTPLLVKSRNWVVRRTRQVQTLHWIFLAAYIDFCLFFFWFFYAFNKTKYVYYVAVMVFLGYLVHRVSVHGRIKRQVVTS